MAVVSENKCGECGAVIPSGSPGDLCGKCLLSLGLEGAQGVTNASALDDDSEVQAQAAGLVGGSIKPSLQTPDPIKTIVVNSSPAEKPGDRIGRYKLLENVGEGGCGVVYVAEQTEPVRRRVALKVIKLGMDTKQVIARFEAERQALAMMDHPNIAKVFDAGTTETGRPYFVMELVRGIRITDYCDQNQLTTQQRLELFIKVCQAIQHAHQKGIIHRDVKPSNILVTMHDGLPVPKVIDFGIAKATEGRLTDATVYTQLHQFIGTPAYMSPEQAEMSELDIDTRSDIYSLGVLLYELLVGSTPFDAEELVASGLDAMRKTICEKEPLRPSTRFATLKGEASTTTAKRRSADTSKLLHQLKGDLDWIVMKCLEKDRTRRYDTANGLAMDLQRHLANEPVVARPPSTAYRVRKFVRRNRVMVIASATVAGVLVLGIFVSTWQAIRATRAERTQTRLREAAQTAQEGERLQAQMAREQAVKATQGEQRAKEGELAARQNLYLANMNAVQQALQENNLNRADSLVEKYFPKPGEEDLRGIEWRYLWNLCEGQEMLTLDFNDYPVNSVTFSPDGRLLALASFDNKVTILDVASRKILQRLGGKFGSVGSQMLAFSRDGKYLAAADRQAVNLWRTKDWRLEHRLDGDSLAGEPIAVAFSPDLKTVATACKGTLAFWDAASGREQSSVDTKISENVWWHPHSLAYSADGKTIAITGGDRIELWNVQPLAKLDWFTGRLDTIMSSAWSSNWLVAGSYFGDLKIWDARTGREIVNFKPHPKFTFGLAFSPDGKTLATGGGDQKIDFWDLTSLPSDSRTTNASSPATSLKKRATLQGHRNQVYALDFSPDGQVLASSSKDGSAKLWNLAVGSSETVLLGAQDPLRFSSNGQSLLALNADQTLSYWDVQSRKKTRLVSPALDTNQVTTSTISMDGNTLAIARTDGTVEFVDLDKHTHIATQAVAAGGRIDDLKFSPSDHLLLVASGTLSNVESAPIVGVLNRATGETQGSFDGARSPFAFSLDERTLVTGGAGYTFKVWDLATHRLLANLRKHTWWAASAAFAPDGKLLMTASSDNTIRLWDTATWMEAGVLKGHMGGLGAAVFSTDGKILMSWGLDNKYALR
jgi:WD40 repeat protein/serine/threonine protein kinase